MEDPWWLVGIMGLGKAGLWDFPFGHKGCSGCQDEFAMAGKAGQFARFDQQCV